MTFKPKSWHPDMTDKESKDVAYWERNMLALLLSDGWYNDDVEAHLLGNPAAPILYSDGKPVMIPRYSGWRRVLSIDGGKYTFHVPDDFVIPDCKPQIERNWDGHTTEQKWERVWELIHKHP